MNVERIANLERRARIHAALADPARLRIVDALSLGDASPSELSALLPMPSNLLAHHVKVLADEGIVTRTRSEGDGRRTYLRLLPEALDVTPGHTRTAQRVLFVCTANSARSQLATALWRRASEVPAVSAGTQPAPQIAAGAIATAARHRLPLRRIRPRRIDQVRAPGDLIITVCDLAHEELGELVDVHWSVPDPVRVGSDRAFNRAFDELSRRVGELAPRLTTS
jgi:ArsR family transcriptional regulator, arsenate/arsenite/antimonite-responsive transcriptional repressor / arsenate reductase (thioredoxin)